MRNIRVPEDFVPADRFEAESSHWMEWVAVSGRPVVVTRKGKAVAVLVAPDDYFGMGDNLDVLRGLAAEMSGLVPPPTKKAPVTGPAGKAHKRKTRAAPGRKAGAGRAKSR